MKAPAVRYPAFWLAGAVLLAVAVRVLWPWTLPARSAVAEGWRRVVEGPPIPASSEPMTVAGAVVRRGMLLSAPTPVTDRPGGRVVETIGRRVFVDVYDVWPLAGDEPPTHYRIGNERPFGWASAEVLLPWSTRLAVRVPDTGMTLAGEGPPGASPVSLAGGEILPVLGWDSGEVQVALWREGQPWEAVDRVVSIPASRLADATPGALLSRAEVVRLLREALDARSPSTAESLRLRAILGQLLDPRPWRPEHLSALKSVLPPWSIDGAGSHATTTALAALNAGWENDVDLSGVSYRLIPLDALP